MLAGANDDQNCNNQWLYTYGRARGRCLAEHFKIPYYGILKMLENLNGEGIICIVNLSGIYSYPDNMARKSFRERHKLLTPLSASWPKPQPLVWSLTTGR